MCLFSLTVLTSVSVCLPPLGSCSIASLVCLFLIWEVGELGDPWVDPQPQLTLNSAVEEGYLGWDGRQVKGSLQSISGCH